MKSQPQLNEFRARIDALDEKIIALLAERTSIVKQLMVLKTDAESVRGCDRVRQVIERVRGLASSHGMPPAIAENTYRALIEALTGMQMAYLEQRAEDEAAGRGGPLPNEP